MRLTSVTKSSGAPCAYFLDLLNQLHDTDFSEPTVNKNEPQIFHPLSGIIASSISALTIVFLSYSTSAATHNFYHFTVNSKSQFPGT